MAKIMNKALRRLGVDGLEQLAAEIREFLITSISDTGGHLASNLGVVELTLALHAVFTTPADKIVWDVGHQAYVHKILTGRKGRFSTLRKMDGLSGFPKPCESEHDAFGTGHSSTAISAALGLALARDFNEEKSKIVAVVGDGSITGGLAYEGLNNAGRANTDLLVVLNDNGMSISKNVGAVARHLNYLRTAPSYLGAKKDFHSKMDKLSVFGETITRGIESAKGLIKYAVLPGVLFEEMGFKYVGPIDGHDIPALILALKRVRRVKGPVLLHALTTKGKGYNIAEKSPWGYHGVGKFDVETGAPAQSSQNLQGISYTEVFSKTLCRCAMRDERIVAITAAMPDGTGLYAFKERFPKRFFDVGIAEGHAVTFAAGLAQGGMKPVFAVYSSFLQRAYDQIIHDVAIQGLPVVFAIDHAGAVGGDGETHQGIYDISFLAHIPGMIILAPANGAELKKMLEFALSHNGPVAIRYPKDYTTDENLDAPCDILRAQTLHVGEKIAIVSVGVMLDTARQVVSLLKEKTKEKNFSPALFNLRCVKPLDENLISELAKYDFIFTIEDGAKIGGVGELICNRLRDNRSRAAVPFAFPDVFPETGTRAELFARYNMNAENIFKKITEVAENAK
ncbi:MAG: 1-deoxy-D-xylulose-5-phosphate synthase [Defluviitaleaceae bacterium]|nr:1-deoxy-D-xylulose-5-phosphate synthase [Defluviitaleaceae bacterium]